MADENAQGGAAVPAERLKVASVELRDGIARKHVAAYVYAALTTVGLLTFISIGTPYVLNVVLHVPTSEQGRLSGDLAFWGEVVLIAVFMPLGMLSDRLGRRRIYAFGFAMMGLGYLLYPMVTSVGELMASRLVYAVGVGAATGMLSTALTEYPVEGARGRLAAVTGMLNGIGLVLLLGVTGALPKWLGTLGFDALKSGQLTHYSVALACWLSALVVGWGLHDGQQVKSSQRSSLGGLVRSAVRAGRNPNLALAFIFAFVARADMVLLGTFSTLWGTNQALAEGQPATHALAHGRIPMIVAESAALLTAPLFGVALDRARKASTLVACFALAGLGYLCVGLVSTPLSLIGLAAFALLGAGHIAAFLASMTLLGQEAPLSGRGSVVGIFNLCGALGILISAGVGGRLYDDLGPHAPFLFAAVLNGLALVSAVVVRIWHGHRDGLGLSRALNEGEGEHVT